MKRLFEILQPAEKGDVASAVFDVIFVTLILFTSINAFVLTFDISETTKAIIAQIENVILVAFTIEFFLRLATAQYLYPHLSKPKAALRYCVSDVGIIDIIAIFPYWLSPFIPFNLVALRTLRLFRMLRIFKLGSYMDGLTRIGLTIKNKRHELVSTILVITVLMFVSAMLMYSVESEAQPDVFRNAGDGLWWALCTLTTVGYGDAVPITGAGKFLASVISLLGMGIVAIPCGIIAAGFTELDEEESREVDPNSKEIVLVIDGETYIAHKQLTCDKDSHGKA